VPRHRDDALGTQPAGGQHRAQARLGIIASSGISGVATSVPSAIGTRTASP